MKGRRMAGHRVGRRRADTDIQKLVMEGKHQVTTLEQPHELLVRVPGPEGSLYEKGVWTVRVRLTDDYPFRPPVVRFEQPFFHPNISEGCWSVSAGALRDIWTMRLHLSELFGYLLPDLLADPNLGHPVNKIAAAIFLHAPEEYQKIVEEYVRQYARAS